MSSAAFSPVSLFVKGIRRFIKRTQPFRFAGNRIKPKKKVACEGKQNYPVYVLRKGARVRAEQIMLDTRVLTFSTQGFFTVINRLVEWLTWAV